MPFREQSYRERCAACGKEATGRCARCGRTFCDEHRAERVLCETCGKEFGKELHDWQLKLEASRIALRVVGNTIGAAVVVLGCAIAAVVHYTDASWFVFFPASLLALPLLMVHKWWLKRATARAMPRARERLVAEFASSRTKKNPA